LSACWDSKKPSLPSFRAGCANVWQALIYKPDILLLDEPFGALDAQICLHVQKLLPRVWQPNWITFLFVAHDVDEAILLSDRVYVRRAHPGNPKEKIWKVSKKGIPAFAQTH
jgi:ABC-type nitrate/sulfonate/bicarbonate transport system ATPase subunit